VHSIALRVANGVKLSHGSGLTKFGIHWSLF